MKKNNFKSLMQAAVLICTPLVIASCDDVFGDADNPIPTYMSIKEAPVKLVLHAAKPDSATYTRTAIAASGAEIVYSSSNEKIATVDAKTGKITAVSEGECDIIAEATGKDSHGNMTYQQQKVSFPVTVKDYRARIALKEDVEIPIYNSALATTVEELDLKEILDVWPAKGTDGLTITFTKQPNTKGDDTTIDPKNVIDATALAAGKISLTGNVGVAKVLAEITAKPAAFEQTSFPDAQKTDTLTIEVKKGVAYISGYDEKGKAVTSYMFKDYNGEKYTDLYDVLTDKGADLGKDAYLKAGWYYLDTTHGDIDFYYNIRLEGDVNIILGDNCHLNMHGFSILDQDVNKYKLNIYGEPDANGDLTGTLFNFDKIKDLKEFGAFGNVINGNNISTIGTININNSSTNASIDKIETLNITNGALSNYISGIGTINLNDGTIAAGMSTVEKFNMQKGTVGDGNNSYSYTKIGELNILGGSLDSWNLSNIGALNIDGGTVDVNSNNRNTITMAEGGKITMNDGKLTVATSGAYFAVSGDVVVNKGEFTATSPDYHAVNGTLTGITFYDKANAGDDWAAIKGTSSGKPYITTKK